MAFNIKIVENLWNIEAKFVLFIFLLSLNTRSYALILHQNNNILLYYYRQIKDRVIIKIIL